MITVISIIISLFITIYQALKVYLYIFLFVLLCYLIYRFLKEKKQGKQHPLRNKEITDLDLAQSFINALDLPKKIIIDKNNIILFLETGIYFFRITNYNNIIEGDINDNFLISKDGKKQTVIKNEYLEYKKDFEKYQNKISIPISSYFVVKNNCHYNINQPEIKIILMKDIYFELKKESQKKLNLKQMEEYYHLLNNM